MTVLRYSPCSDSFAYLRQNGSYYVDKTRFLQIIAESGMQAILFTRPRRFGKTLFLSTMEAFFACDKETGDKTARDRGAQEEDNCGRQPDRAWDGDSASDLFANLEIAANRDFCERWQNRYPVVALTLRDVAGTSYTDAHKRLAGVVRAACNAHAYLFSSPEVPAFEKGNLLAIAQGTADPEDWILFLRDLTRALFLHHKKRVIVLVDEYDKPLTSAHEHGYADKMLFAISSLLTAGFKSNDALQFGVITGLTSVIKESSHSSLNNLKCYGVSDAKYADLFGFTAWEVDRILKDAGLTGHKQAVRDWYDGYHFGGTSNTTPGSDQGRQDIFCPWDIIQYVADLQDMPGLQPRSYWVGSNTDTIILESLRRHLPKLVPEIQTLTQGGCILVRLKETLSFKDLFTEAEYFWTLLHTLGYLTRASLEQEEQCGLHAEHRGEAVLTVPNRELMEVFCENVEQWFARIFREGEVRPLLEAFWAGDCDALTQELTAILQENASNFDLTREDVYHALLLGLFSLYRSYAVSSNREQGHGRADLLVEDVRNRRAAVIEIKHAHRPDGLKQKVQEALQQIVDKKYDVRLRREAREGKLDIVLHWGIAFCGKACLSEVVRLQP